MELQILMLANGFFLILILVVLVFLSMRNGHPTPSNVNVEEDINKIKNQIIDK